ncbi:heterogeneous nuclear ribonucleoprotein U-like protein 1 isoform X2 [Cynara cardunculus var. scolymus]|uniref:heterogeneous nuclear ribonucleoprotein U-like protein 1 isoform X2 n=1 Tax=Cynara cardunculus var. scolymus TaxID=59895 RepID=UPI000D62B58A|nr:heterogeneous nuclear ribonucleoprotein U-like protein 1 isoform X2 [Cynara cardunculus var. scolymus]
MASWMKRERSLADESPSTGKKPRVNYDGQSLTTSHRVVLNTADCDLDFDIEGDGLKGSALYEHGFAYCWSGARANIGITGGKYCFSCKVVSPQLVDMDDTPIDQKHLCRVGISRGDDKVGNLGETEHSFGFGGTGKFSNAGKFSTYGEKFDIGDTILCAVDLESKPMASISFTKNGKWLGTARHFNAGPTGLGVIDSPIKELHWESAVFPHVLLKNVVVQLQFSYEDGLVPQDGYRPWASAIEDGKGLLGPSFSDVYNCELIMMVGLPASGKTTWAERWVNDHPEKRYILLGTNLALDQMKVPGLLRKQNYGERFDCLMDRATMIFNTLLTRASKTPRNFIIDQTNVYKSARKRKLKPFANFQKIAVVVFPRPEDLKARSAKRFREMGKEVPAEAVNEMLANFVLPKSKDMPGTDEYFDQVIYVELNMTESKRCLDEMKAKMQLGISVSPCSHQSSLQSYSSNPVRHSQENVLQPHRSSSTHQYPPESSTHFSHPTSGHYAQGNSLPTYDSPALQYQATPSGGNWQGSYPSQPILPNMHGNEPSKGRFLPRDDFNHRRSYSGYTANVIHHGPPIERYATSSSFYDASGGPLSASGAPQVDMHTPTQSRFLPATSIPYGSAYGTPDSMNPQGNYPPNYDGYQSRLRYY